MALTPAEQAELDQLEAQQKDHITRQFGDPVANNYVAGVSQPAQSDEETHSSIFRSVVGIPRDALAGVFDLAETLGDKMESAIPLPIVRFGSDASNGVIDVVSGQKAADYANTHRILPSIPNLPGSEHAGTAEKLIRGIGSFLIPYAGWSKKLGVMEAGLSLTSRIARGAGAGFLADLSQDPSQTNMATAIKDTFGLDNPTLDALAYHADGDDLAERLKAAATNLPVGVAADGLFELGATGIRAYRAWKGGAEEARGVVDALEHDYGIKRPKPAPDASPEEARNALLNAGEPAAEPFDNTIHSVLQENPPKTWEDVVTFLNRIVDDPHLKDETVGELAKIAHEDPENALTRLGIDPAKLDYEAFDKPEAVKNLHNALINIYEKAANKIGRTGTTVSEASLVHTAARSFASDADVLRTLFGQTKNLPEILMGARMFVGGHAKRLLDDAEGALDAIRAGGEGSGEQEWQKFLGSFYRHALYLGSLRGAGSEIARALRSLQFVARHDPEQARTYAQTIEKMVPAGAKTDAEGAAKTQLDSLVSMDSDAERMMVLSKLLEKQGDTGALATYVRRMNGSIGKQINQGVIESVGNLFSQGTAAYNFASTMTMLGLRSLGRWMSAGARTPFGLLSENQARLARIARADAWAYQDGMMLSLSEAWRNMWTRLKANSASELFLNADNLGLKKVAKRAAEWNAEGAKLTASGKTFDRVDMTASQHVIAFSPSDRRAIDGWVEHYDMPRLMEGALKWMARAAGVGINALGTATRAGTILAVNAPDELAGTMAYKAGSQSAAVREAARRAAELGIEGKDLSKYLKARVASLTADVGNETADKAYEAGFKDTVHAAGEHEARAALFQDRLETGIGRGAEWLIGHTPILGPLFVPFVHTPMRILEVSLLDYTPLGAFKSRIRQAILNGTPQQREQALSQLGLGIMGMYLGYHLTSNRTIVGKDGSFFSTAREARESYTFQVGGDTFEFSRMDPMATILGLSADFHEYMNTYYDPNDPQADSTSHAMAEAVAWAIAANVLSKSYLESLRNMTEMAGAFTDGQFKAHFDKYASDTLARRFVPAAGIQKGLRQIYDPYEHEAVSFFDKVLQQTMGATKLPIKRDWLGAPVETNFGERFTGLTWEPYKGNEDPLRKELDWVSLDTRLPRKQLKGVDLTASQYSRLLELRGQVVEGKYGKMDEGLRKLIALPGYQSLTRDAKEFQIRSLTDGYTKLAGDALLKEDKQLQGKVYLEEAYQDAKNKGASPEQLHQKAQQFREELQKLGYM